MKKYLIIDFDSTFVQVEGLEELAKISLNGLENRKKILHQIKKITDAGMRGELPFEESLSRRLKLIKANRNHVKQTADLIKNKISLSFLRNKTSIRKMIGQIYIVSGAFRELILPTIALFNIKPDHVLANDFVYDKYGKIVGCDQTNPLSQNRGKATAVQAITPHTARLPARQGCVVWAVGDGITDYEIKKLGAADYFIAYTENTRRKEVVDKADWEVKNFNQLLKLL